MIKSDVEFEAKFAELRRFYLATHHEFSKVVVTESRAADLIKMSGVLVGRINDLLSEIEEYTGASEIRRLCAAMQDIRAARIKKELE